MQTVRVWPIDLAVADHYAIIYHELKKSGRVLSLVDLAQSDRSRQEAKEEPTLSGELRRAIHSSEQSLSAISKYAGISPIMLDEFLIGERTVRSDVLDRLATVLGFRFQPMT